MQKKRESTDSTQSKKNFFFSFSSYHHLSACVHVNVATWGGGLPRQRKSQERKEDSSKSHVIYYFGQTNETGTCPGACASRDGDQVVLIRAWKPLSWLELKNM